ncbi:DUF397 domain-containing protein [Streptomyces mutabilis]|uniref:DUF397 domain-containing protein n=1 Tax=Streptomyces mutabilis TaxID=67332 RepID=UPI0034491A22
MNWHKSTYSTGYNNCVEVADGAVVLVRDTKNHGTGIVKVSPAGWAVFIAETRRRA